MSLRYRSVGLLGLVACLGLILNGLASVAQAERWTYPSDIQPIKSVNVGFPGMVVPRGQPVPAPFKVATWTPVRVELADLNDDWQGKIEVTAPDSDGIATVSTFYVERPVNSGQKSRTALGYVRIGTLESEIKFRLLDVFDTQVGPPVVVTLKQPLTWSSLLVLGAGNCSGLEELPSLSKFADTPDGSPGLVIAAWKELPDQALGLDAVEALVLASDDETVIERLAGPDGAVLRDWVLHGGHLVVSLSPKNWQRVGEVLKDLLPARPTGPQTLVDLAAVEGFADKVSRQIKQPMTVVKLEPMDSKTVTLAATAATPLVVRRAFGLGRVTLTGVDVSVEPFSTWSDRKSYWDKLIDIRGRSSDAEAAGAVAGGALIQSANPDLAARLLQALGTFPGVSLIPFGWVAGLIFAYLLLIGPIDYFLLKRVFKRMEWTWITFPLIVLATTILAFQLARAMKGSDLRVNRIDLMDVEQATGIYRGSTWMTVLSPGNHDFGFELHGYTPNLNPLKLSEGNSSFSWFAPPEAGLSRIGRIALGNHKVEVKKSGLSGERIPIWSTKSFSGRWSGLSGPVSLVESTLRTEPGDRAGGSIRNRSGKTLQRAQLYYGKNVYDLGTIRPDNIARVSSTRSEAIPRALGRFVQEALRAGKPVEDAAAGRTGIRGAEVSPPAAGLLRAALFHDAMGSRADVYPSFPLRPLDLTNQVVDLRRPVLVAEIEDEACSVIIQGGPDGSLVPKVQQMTVVRIILDMDAPTPVNPNSTPASAPASPSSSSADATSGTVP